MPPTQPTWLVSMLLFLRGILQPNVMAVDWKQFEWHTPSKLYSTAEIQRITHFNQDKFYNFNLTLDQVLRVRVPGTKGHDHVREFIESSLTQMGFEIEEDSFTDQTPHGTKPFRNIIATHNPKACKRLVLACHYDSKYDPSGRFLGATDSAVPCAMLIEMARNLLSYLNERRNDETTLQLVFFDGEEAFQTWTDTDSLYGSRHLARKWNQQRFPRTAQEQERCGSKRLISELDRIDLFVLLDLLGAAHPRFYSFYPETNSVFGRLIQIEEKLNALKLLQSHPPNVGTNYFQKRMFLGGVISDDHVPFVKRDVPVLHIIPSPFPAVWHKLSDNKSALHHPTIVNLMKIFQIFICSYLHL